MIIDTNPEFGIELTLVVPYAYWLHTQNKLEKVITSKGMSPFYYFCDNVEEKYTSRTVDNSAAGLDNIPNNWIYGTRDNAKLYKDEWPEWTGFTEGVGGCGILNYTKWKLPDYNLKFKNNKFKLNKPFIVICNRYNWEHGKPPTGFFSIECLHKMFDYFTSKGYDVLYKRPSNTEFPLDQNEITTIMNKECLVANVTTNSGDFLINDWQLAKQYPGVYLLNDLVNQHEDMTYNQVQINYFTNASGFITMGGGSTLFPCLFQKPTVAYYGGTLTEINRKDFWKDANGNKNIKNYHYMMNPNLTPFIDKDGIDMKNGYKNFLETITKIF